MQVISPDRVQNESQQVETTWLKMFLGNVDPSFVLSFESIFVSTQSISLPNNNNNNFICFEHAYTKSQSCVLYLSWVSISITNIKIIQLKSHNSTVL